jgi:hypothetical protein
MPAVGGAGSLTAAGDASALSLYSRAAEELTADDFGWRGAEGIAVVPSWLMICGDESLDKQAHCWLVTGVVLGVACLILQILSVADPVNFAGA